LEQQRLDDLAIRYEAERKRDKAELQNLKDEKNRELEGLKRERDSIRREAEDLI